MNEPSNSKIRSHLTHIAASALWVLAAALAVSALTAESPAKPQTKRGECKDWPSDPDKPKVAAAFTKALNDSAMDNNDGKKVRKNLLDPKTAKSTVQGILNTLYPGEKIVFPTKAEVRFYEPEELGFTAPAKVFTADYPSEHCLHIFYLPEVGEQAQKASFQTNLMCCYKPW